MTRRATSLDAAPGGAGTPPPAPNAGSPRNAENVAIPVPGLLVLDTSYTFEMIRERGLEDSVICRDLDGYFEHVWSVHPFATMLTSDEWGSKFGKPRWHVLNAAHTFVEGTAGRFSWLGHIFFLNFLLSQASLFFTLAGLIRRHRIKLIRVGDPLYLGLFGWALARVSGIPLVVRVNGNYDKVREFSGSPIFPRLFRTAAIEKAVEQFVLKRADLVAALNQDNLDFALSSGATAGRSTIFRLGNIIAKEHLVVPANREFQPSLLEKLGVKAKRYLLCMGRLEPIKFPDDAIRVLAELHRRGLPLKLVFAGDGQMQACLTDLASQLGVRDHVVFAGNQNQAALAQLIPQAGVVVSPLTGRSLTEAAFGEAPIVAYDLDWQGELVETGVTGELVPFREWQRLADGAERLLREPVYAAEMGQSVRKRALEILDPAAQNEHERAEYGALLRRRS